MATSCQTAPAGATTSTATFANESEKCLNAIQLSNLLNADSRRQTMLNYDKTF